MSASTNIYLTSININQDTTITSTIITKKVMYSKAEQIHTKTSLRPSVLRLVLDNSEEATLEQDAPKWQKAWIPPKEGEGEACDAQPQRTVVDDIGEG